MDDDVGHLGVRHTLAELDDVDHLLCDALEARRLLILSAAAFVGKNMVVLIEFRGRGVALALQCPMPIILTFRRRYSCFRSSRALLWLLFCLEGTSQYLPS